MMKKLMPVLLFFVLLVPLNATTSCTPPGERTYFEEWTLTEMQSLLHKCALGSLINFSILGIFDPRQSLLDLISSKSCNWLRQKTQPYRDDLNAEIDAINADIEAFNNAQNVDSWFESEGSPYNNSYSSQIQGLEGLQYEYNNGSGNTGVLEGVDLESLQGAVGQGGEADENNQYQSPPINNFIPPENKQNEPVTSEPGNPNSGLIDRGEGTGVDRFPMPKPSDWNGMYKGLAD